LRPRGEPICVVSEVEFAYGALEVLRGVDFDVKAGELLCIVGPNGAGKSTMLNVLTDGKLPTEGSIAFFLHDGEVARRGKPIHAITRAGVARKFQIPRLFDSLTVAETILLAQSKGRIPSFWRRTKRIPRPARSSTSSTRPGSTGARTRRRRRSRTGSNRGSSSRPRRR
jgi:branched-chain amino acid transport system permease protein